MEKDTIAKPMESIQEIDEEFVPVTKSTSFLQKQNTNSRQRAVTNIEGGILTIGS